MKSRQIAILELLDKCCFERVMLINSPIEIQRSLKNRSNELFLLKSKSVDKFKSNKKKFDLIISFSCGNEALDLIEKIYSKDNCEILIIHKTNTILGLAKSLKFRIKSSNLFPLKNIDRELVTHTIERYYAFPNIENPEMILTKEGFKDHYFRYWSWRRFHLVTLFNLLEMLFIRYLNSAIFSNNLITKIKLDKNA
jgi:hypothetical protein